MINLTITDTVEEVTITINEHLFGATGPRGEDFLYEHFTEEQITNLKKPAIDAATVANTATENSNEATENANTATAGAIEATAGAVEATENVIAATDGIIEATEAAVTATADAIEAKDNAVTATAQANEARDGAVTATDGAITATAQANAARDGAITATSEANAARDGANASASLAGEATFYAVEATAGAVEAKDNAITATTQANAARDGANTAKDNAVTATTQANAARDGAVTAKDNAVTATNDAITAKNNADTATAQANTARDLALEAALVANSAKGWTPQIRSIADGVDRRVIQLYGYIGGTGTAPTTNLNQYFTDAGGWTSNIALASNYKGAPGITTTNMATNRLLGRVSAGTGTPQELEPVGFYMGSDGKFYNASYGVSEGYAIASMNNPSGGLLLDWGLAQTGTLCIKLPSNTVATLLIKGSIWSTGGNLSGTFIISAYPSSMGVSTTAIFTGGVSYPVRWYTNGADKYVYIGDTTTVWGEKTIILDNVQAALSNPFLFATGWVMTFETAFLGTQNGYRTAAQNLPNSNSNQIEVDYNAASGVDTALTNAMSELQMFQNLQKQNDNRYTKAQGDARYLPKYIHTAVQIGYLIATDIPQKSNIFFLMELKGNGYSVNLPIDIILQGYVDATTDFVWCKAISSGGFSFNISLFYKDGFVCFWIPALTLNASIVPYLYTSTAGNTPISPRATTLTSEVKPTTGVTAEITITPLKTLLGVISTAPASATAIGTAGTVIFDANYIYVCTATNTWKRTALTTW